MEIKDLSVLSAKQLATIVSKSTTIGFEMGMKYCIETFISGSVDEKKLNVFMDIGFKRSAEAVIDKLESSIKVSVIDIIKKLSHDEAFSMCEKSKNYISYDYYYQRTAYPNTEFVKVVGNMVYIFTKAPNSIIGEKGCFIDKLSKELKKHANNKDINIEIVEIIKK